MASTTKPWRQMAEGDSFLIPFNGDYSQRNGITRSACYWGRVVGARFSTRKTPDGYRVTRMPAACAATAAQPEPPEPMMNRAQIATAIRDGHIPALSIRQPWAHHILHDGKDIENRGWPAKRRGWILIHAGVTTAEDPDLIRAKGLPLGGIVGLVRITGCVTASVSPWFVGPFGFTLADPLALPLIPCPGRLSFFLPAPHILAKVAQAVLEAAPSMPAE